MTMMSTFMCLYRETVMFQFFFFKNKTSYGWVGVSWKKFIFEENLMLLVPIKLWLKYQMGKLYYIFIGHLVVHVHCRTLRFISTNVLNCMFLFQALCVYSSLNQQ